MRWYYIFFNVFNLICCILLTFFLSVILTYVIYKSSDLITSLGTYHKRKRPDKLIDYFKITQSSNEETFLFKCGRVAYYSLILSTPLLLVFFYYIPSLIKSQDTLTYFFLTITTTFCFVICIRLTANPTKTILLKRIAEIASNRGLNWTKNDNVLSFFDDDEVKSVAKNHKERTLSF